MDPLVIVTIITSITSLLGVIAGFIIQRDLRKIRDTERENKALKSIVSKSVLAIQGYQLIETEIAKEQGLHFTAGYRSKIRKGKGDFFFDSNFLSPNNISKMVKKYHDYS
jgi:hypothetical protein